MAKIINNMPASTKSSSKPYYPFDNFKRSIKRDPDLFPDFKYQYQAIWENCNHNSIATSCTQDVEDIFHEAYLPSATDEIALFKEKRIHVPSFC